MGRSNQTTRRGVLKTGIGVTSAGLLAGCGGSEADDESAPAETTTGGAAGSSTTVGADDSADATPAT